MSFVDPQVVARTTLDEVSGIAVGVHGTWLLEDSGNPPVLTRLDGVRVRLPTRNTDWEDLAAAPDADGRPSLWVADTGDNRSVRDEVQVLEVAEPAGSTAGRVTSYRFTYEDGPHDAEALLVLPGGRRIAVVTKALSGSSVYTAALGDRVLTKATDLRLRPTGTRGGPAGPFGSVLVTGGAVSPDGRRVVLRTYTDVLEWPLLDSLAATFAQTPVSTALPPQPQGEAVTYSRDGQSLLVASEGEGTPVQRLTRSEPSSSSPPSPSPVPRPVAAPQGPQVRPLFAVPVVALLVLFVAGRAVRRRR